jgi:hypothetical protein
VKKVLVALVFALFACAVAWGQDTAKPDATNDTMKAAAQDKSEAKSASRTKTVTGCLEKGDEAGEFVITGDDSKKWELRSSTVKLDEHVGHKVTVTGAATRDTKGEEKQESKAEEKKEGKLEKAAGKEEYGELRVTKLKMVSDSCNK